MPKLTGFAKVPIPGPRTVPFLGPLANVARFLGDPVGRTLALHREFGDIVALSEGNPALVCAFGAERNREVLTAGTVFQHDPSPPVNVPEDSAVRRINTSLIFMNGERHRRQRRLLSPAFTKAAIDGYRDEMARVTDVMLRRWPTGRTADVADLLLELTLCVAVRCLFGMDIGDDALTLGRLAVEHIDGLTSPFTVLFPFRIRGTPYSNLMHESEVLEARLRTIIAEKRAQPVGQSDALSLMLRANDDDGSTFTDTELLGQAALLFAAGHETTSDTLTWAIFLLAQHPRVLGDLLDELDAKLHGDAPTAQQVTDLPLLDRVIKETMRLLPSAHMLFTRVCAREAPLGPYVLPEGASVVLSPLVTQRDPARFSEPMRFRPERWEELTPSTYEYLPFGAGPRMCLGMGFGSLALRVILPLVLQRYRFTLAHNATISRRARGVILGTKHGMPMLIAPQDRAFTRRERVRGDIHELVDLS